MAVVLRQLMEVCPPEFRDKRDPYGWTPLHILASNRDANRIRPGMIATLCKARADPDQVKGRHNQTPLMCAVSTAHQPAADMLILYGADVNKETTENTTMFDMAWHNREMRSWVADMGVGEGAGVSGSGRLLLAVCRYGNKPALPVAKVGETIVGRIGWRCSIGRMCNISGIR